MDRTIYQGRVDESGELDLVNFPANIVWQQGKPPRDDKNGSFFTVNVNHDALGGFVVVPCTSCLDGKFGYEVDGMIHTVPHYMYWGRL